MKKFMKEFKDFISKGNVLDMAVGIIIGGAFTAIVSSLVADIINPILGLFGGINFDQLSIKMVGDSELFYGKFITSVINFLIMALIVFFIVKGFNKAGELTKKKKKGEPEETPAPTEKDCPYCKGKIPVAAVKCMFCTSDVE